MTIIRLALATSLAALSLGLISCEKSEPAPAEAPAAPAEAPAAPAEAPAAPAQ